MPFRTTVSASFWTDTIEEAQAEIAQVHEVLPATAHFIRPAIQYFEERPDETGHVGPYPEGGTLTISPMEHEHEHEDEPE